MNSRRLIVAPRAHRTMQRIVSQRSGSWNGASRMRTATNCSGLGMSAPGPTIGSKPKKLRISKCFPVCPPKADTSESGHLIARRADLLSNYLSQRFIDPVLPARPGVLKVIKNVPVNSQRDKLLGIRDGRTLGREFRGLRGCRFKRRFSRVREVVALRVLSAVILC